MAIAVSEARALLDLRAYRVSRLTDEPHPASNPVTGRIDAVFDQGIVGKCNL